MPRPCVPAPRPLGALLAALACAVLLGLPHPGGAAAETIAAGNALLGREKAGTCGGCHGPDGNSSVPTWPKLAGQQSFYIVKQLKDFKYGIRTDPMMSGVAAGLSEQDMADIAAWYSTQKVRPGPGSGNRETGRRLFMEGDPSIGISACAVCHGDAATGAIGLGWGGFPSLRGQHSAYLSKQLRDFQAGRRKNDQGGMMSHIAAKLSPEEIASLSAYLEALE